MPARNRLEGGEHLVGKKASLSVSPSFDQAVPMKEIDGSTSQDIFTVLNFGELMLNLPPLVLKARHQVTLLFVLYFLR